MVTVWIFFGSAEAGAGGAAAAGIGTGVAGGGETPLGAGGGGQTLSVAGAPVAAGDEPCPPTIGIVETTRGAAFGGSILTGCSSRETILSVEPVAAKPVRFALLAWESGTILLGPSFALMIGGSVGNTEPPNMAR
jgi:hypothetical protein